MEPRQIETPVRFSNQGQTSLPPQPERKRRFQLIRLEERIAPGNVGRESIFSGGHGGHTACHNKHCRGG